MIYITGDIHGRYTELINRFSAYAMTDDDTVIVCGDFGFVWDDSAYNPELEKIAGLPFTIAFCDGNHENFNRLYMYPVEEWHGGKVHRLNNNTVHLMRGEIYRIEGKSFFAFGGAYSIDRYMRIENLSWWKKELPDAGDYKNASVNIEKVNLKVDAVITHQIPQRFIRALGSAPDAHDIELTGYLEWLYSSLEFSKWYAGHWHVNRSFDNGKMNILFENVVCFD